MMMARQVVLPDFQDGKSTSETAIPQQSLASETAADLIPDVALAAAGDHEGEGEGDNAEGSGAAFPARQAHLDALLPGLAPTAEEDVHGAGAAASLPSGTGGGADGLRLEALSGAAAAPEASPTLAATSLAGLMPSATPASVEGPVFAAATVPPSIELSDLDGSDGFVLNGLDPSDTTGYSVSSAGDVNGDGFDDFLIAAEGADVIGSNNEGQVYLIFGKAETFGASFDLSALDGADGVLINGVALDDRIGRSVSSAGDINGDGFDDIIIGAPTVDVPPGYSHGAAYVIFGKAGGFTSSLDLVNLDGSDGFRILGLEDGDQLGYSVSSAGDVNGDGLDDLIVGAPYADPDGNSNAGEAYVIFGTTNGFTADFDLAALDGSDGFVIKGIDVNDRSGWSVNGIGDINGSGPGDINGDGFDDLIIGAPFADQPGSIDDGEAYVVFGGDSFGASLDLADLDGSNGFLLTGETFYDSAGRAVAGIGDIDGDGFADFAVAAPLADPDGTYNAGQVYVFIGRPHTFEPVIDLGDLGGRGFVIEGIGSVDSAGMSVAGAGDINGDGFDDILIGAPQADPGGRTSAGQAYVIFGRGDDEFPSTIDLASLDGSDGFALNGVLESDFAGRSVSSAGDIDNDGFDDLIIGANGADPGGDSAAGAAYIVYGGPDFTNDVTAFGDGGANTLNGNAQADVILGLKGADTLKGRGGADRLFGGDGADSLDGGGGNDELFGGRGQDTLLGRGGADRLFGNGGVDDLDGGDGDDLLNGGTGKDTLTGGAGADSLVGGADNDTLNGGLGADELFGNRGKDLLIGGGQGDTLSGGNDNDELRGGAGKDVLTGGEGNDILNGGAGGDTMRGSVGDDTFIVGQAGDTVIENAGNGTDLVMSTIDYTLGANLENLTLIGNADRAGTGNGLDNEITGNGGRNTLTGKGGADSLFGGADNDLLIGGAGRDLLDGGSGRDTMRGGGGNDTYIVDQSNDTVSEASGAGSKDLVKASANYTLGANVENLTLTGGGSIDGTGNALANTIRGNNAANELNGRGGDDVLTGRGGNDVFLLNTGSGDDRITDFKSGQDKIDVSAYGFTTGAQVLAATSNQGGNAVIQLDNNNTVELTGVTKNQLSGSDFIVEDDGGPPDKLRLPPSDELEAGRTVSFNDLLDEGDGEIFAGGDGGTAGHTDLGALSLFGDLDIVRVSDDDLSTVIGIV